MCKPSEVNWGVNEWFGHELNVENSWFSLNFTWIFTKWGGNLVNFQWFSLNLLSIFIKNGLKSAIFELFSGKFGQDFIENSRFYAYARKILLRKLFRNFFEFCQKYFHRVGPSRSNSLCKNLKKWEKNRINHVFWAFSWKVD